MDLIRLTRLERNGKAESVSILLDINDINRPIVENEDNNCVLYVQESILYKRGAENINSVQYIVDEDLTAITALSARIFKGTVEKRDGRDPVLGFGTLCFVTSKIVGAIQADGTGSKFFYHEDDGSLPVEYKITENIAAIELMLV